MTLGFGSSLEQSFERSVSDTLPSSCTIPNIPSCFADAPKGVEILLSSSGKNILPGDLVTLTCQVNSSYPAISSVQWAKDGVSLGTHGYVLQLSSVAWNDSGVYTCQATNNVGSMVSPPVSLHVFSKSWMRLALTRKLRGPGGPGGTAPEACRPMMIPSHREQVRRALGNGIK